MSFRFKKPDVYQKSMAFIDEAAVLTEALPRSYGFLANQLSLASAMGHTP